MIKKWVEQVGLEVRQARSLLTVFVKEPLKALERTPPWHPLTLVVLNFILALVIVVLQTVLTFRISPLNFIFLFLNTNIVHWSISFLGSRFSPTAWNSPNRVSGWAPLAWVALLPFWGLSLIRSYVEGTFLVGLLLAYIGLQAYFTKQPVLGRGRRKKLLVIFLYLYGALITYRLGSFIYRNVDFGSGKAVLTEGSHETLEAELSEPEEEPLDPEADEEETQQQQ